MGGSVRRLRLFAAVAAAGLALAACSSTDDTVDKTTPPDVLFNTGLAQLEAGKTTSAVKSFEDVDRLHPYSELAKKSILLQAYSNFQKGAYTDAIQASKRFVTLYPSHKDAAYAQYLIGESYYAQIPDITRDQDITNKSLEAYGDVIKKYPDSPYAKDAQKKIDFARDQLAGKEMEVGRFYLSKKQYLAAISRFRKVVSDYQTTRHVEEALSRLVESYYALGVVKEAQTAAAVLGHNFPDSQWYRDSYALLKSGGYEPEVASGSWITKALGKINVI
ncbi:outer membrane protein assembly factor BamD [Prosthecodimorpha staleyi]|uniref:Outer membrane protein assembly factor BamD n=1 Tax=Prosthecodimorpha staleyi TaxID=2840188 RepID=A0A947D5S8_9HYPH|nr:outer membrane protein assembly factor BamD [Prosthecodimorpha staleyi]MBT9291391.1 outer membrane protein assembly factor BamD [Prosthecodimorpha staleyi]